jgi:hypothetical protein
VAGLSSGLQLRLGRVWVGLGGLRRNPYLVAVGLPGLSRFRLAGSG